MMRLAKSALALGILGAAALATAAPSEARSGRNNTAAFGAGAAAGALLGAAAATAASPFYYGVYGQPYAYRGGYAYAPAYRGGYAYAPGFETYAAAPDGVTRYDPRDPSSYYAPGGAYGPHSYSGWDNRERALSGGDW